MRLTSLRQNAAVVLLIALLAFAGYGVYATRAVPPAPRNPATRRAPSALSVAVDETPLNTIEQLLRLPTRPEERAYAQSALRLAGQDLDLAFAQAVRQAA